MIGAICCLFLLSCEDLEQEDGALREGEHLVQIAIDSQNPQYIATRAHSEEEVRERMENVALFVFNADGSLYKKMFQLLDQEKAFINMYLSDATYTACAVVNLENPERFYQAINRLEDLQNYAVTLAQPSEAFRGTYVMSGSNTLEVNASNDHYTITVSRSR